MFKVGVIPMPGTILLTARDIEYRIAHAEATLAVVDADGAQRVLAVRDRLPTLRHLIVVGEAPAGDCVEYAVGGPRRPRSANPAPRADAQGRPDAHLLHQRHRRLPEDGAAHPGLLRPRPRDHRRASGSTCGPATCTGRCPTPAGPRPPGAGSSARGRAARASSRWRAASSTPEHRPRASLERADGHHVLRAADAVPAARAGRTSKRTTCPRLRHCVSAGEPLNPEVIGAWKRGHRAHHPRRLRPDRDGGPGRQLPLAARCARARWASRRRASTCASSTTTARRAAGAARRATSRCASTPRAAGRAVRRATRRRRRQRRSPSAATGTSPATGPWRDADGYFWFVGRDDDVITSSAYRIGPFEVESALVEHPAVAEAAVVGKRRPRARPDRQGVRGPGAGPRRARRAGAASSRSTSSELTAPYKYPREIEFVDRAAQDGQRQDPPRRAAPARGGRPRPVERAEGRRPCRGDAPLGFVRDCRRLTSAEQGEHALGALVGLGEHRGAGLREDLQPGEVDHLLRPRPRRGCGDSAADRFSW